MSGKARIFRHSALTFACATGLLAAGTGHAVNINPRGLGQVLLYPYYTVNGGQQTLVTVANTSDRVKAVRVTFREGRNGKPALRFSVYLGAHDVWTGAVYATDANGPAQLISNDTSCTAPRIVAGSAIPFRNYAYAGTSADGGGVGLERTRDGFIELIEMGNLQSGTGPFQLAEEATHGPNGAAPNCDALIDAFTRPAVGSNWSEDPTQSIDLPSGGLQGDGQIVDVANGTMVAYRAEALANFYTNASAPGALHVVPGSDRPDLRDANNGGGVATARVLHDDGTSNREDFPTGGSKPDAVSLALLQSAAINTYNFESGLAAATDLVVTFPTKSFYVDVPFDSLVGAPFTNAFGNDGRGLEVIAMTLYSREQRPYQPDECIDCSPPPPQLALAGSVNVLGIGQQGTASQTSVLKASIGTTATAIAGFDPTQFASSGWLNLVFDNRRTLASEHVMVGPTTGIRYAGLPAIGFAAFRYLNTNAQPGLLANYAGAIGHTFTAPIETLSSGGN